MSLVLLGERANAKRSFLLVSTVLGKHVPLEAARCRLAGAALAFAVAGQPGPALDGGATEAAAFLRDELPARGLTDAVVLGFAETATGLAHQVGEALDCAWLQTTTRHPSAAAQGLAFAEAHSHAPEQWLLPLPDGLSGPLVLVDDELSTGATAGNLIRVLHARQPRERYVVAALLDARPPGPGPLDALAAELGVRIDVAAVAVAPRTSVPEPGWSGGTLPIERADAGPPDPHRPSRSDLTLPGPPRTEREGLDRAARAAFRRVAEDAAAATGPLEPGALVLGCGEHLALPQLAALAAGPGTLTSSTTRSPALVSDAPGYPLVDGLAFPHPEEPGKPGFAYNVRPASRPHVVVHFAEPAHRAAADGLLAALAPATRLTTVTLT